MRLIALVVASVVGSVPAAAFASERLRVPRGQQTVLVDNRFEPGEWSDAAKFEVPGHARVYVKQDRGIVALAIEWLKDKTGSVDLYLSPEGGELYNLHASAKLGERTLKGAQWPDEWTWWNNEGWVASVGRVDDWSKRTFVDEPVREFQIRRSRFPGKRWKVMFELMNPAKPQWTTVAYPAGAKNTSTEGWIVLELE